MTDDFDDVFQGAEDFHRKFLRKMFSEIEDLEEAMRKGRLQGQWDIKPIEEPNVKGYIARGRFQLGGDKQPKTLALPEHISEETREALMDVFQDEDNVKLYIELPGVEKEDIQLNITKGQVKINARNFHKSVDLPAVDLKVDAAVSSYKNGVLEVTVPKTKKT